ncbi:MAG: hypothetical protein NTY51_10640 [Deltaproteobacteria bacterium]|jgi:hypothetical protein|nr:hypothetical protein [Deltaproteobacteria bacterium]
MTESNFNMDDEVRNPFEELEIRCPRLGGPVTFSYCCVEAIDLPCSRSLICWSDRFDVGLFFRQKLDPEKFGIAFGTPQKTRLESIIELIERAKKLNPDDSKQSK